MLSLIDTLESEGLSAEQEPSPEQWQKMMTSDKVQQAIQDFGKACDAAGVPPDANIMSALMGSKSSTDS